MKKILAALPLVVVAAPVAALPADDWVSSVVVIRDGPARNGEVFTDDPKVEPNWGTVYAASTAWLSPTDMPADLRNRHFKGTTVTLVDTDESGRVIACRVLKSSGDTRLDTVACSKLRALGKFPLYHQIPGKAVQHLNISVGWSTESRAALDQRGPPLMAPAPPRPIDYESSPQYTAWPRMRWNRGLKIDRFPDLQAEYKTIPGRHGEGQTTVDLLVAADGAVTCVLGIGSGDLKLDARACAVGQSLALSYTRPCDACSPMRLPLKFVWRQSGSYIAVPAAIGEYGLIDEPIPRDPADQRPPAPTGISSVPYGRGPSLASPRPKDLDFTRFDWSGASGVGSFRIALSPENAVTGCTTLSSSGVAEADAQFCRALTGMRWQNIPNDVFGDVASAIFLTLRLAPRPNPPK